MMGGLIGWLVAARRAEADARHLRALYGAGAEAWCASALAMLTAGDRRCKSIRLIAKALRAIPVPNADEALTPSGANLAGSGPANAGRFAQEPNPVAGRRTA
jgi:hypothetical protein